jgi:two-component system OmpR family response regulator
MNRKIAIVEDDPDQRENYADALSRHGFEVTTYPNRRLALKGFENSLPDLAILDIMLEDEPDGGFDLCRELRSMSRNLPIIFLTARDNDIDTVSGLRLDAWDYLTKPVNLQYLAVRVSSLFRIVDTLSNKHTTVDQIYRHGDLVVDQQSMAISWKGQPINMTLTEYWLVESMARRPGHVRTYDHMMQVTRQSMVERNTINGYIRRIRNKFKAIDPAFDRIQTVFGVGYRWKA